MGVSTSPSCPAYWPDLIWRIHHPLVGLEAEQDPRIEALDSFFAAIAIQELTSVLRGPKGRVDPKVMAAFRKQLLPFIEAGNG